MSNKQFAGFILFDERRYSSPRYLWLSNIYLLQLFNCRVLNVPVNDVNYLTSGISSCNLYGELATWEFMEENEDGIPGRRAGAWIGHKL